MVERGCRWEGRIKQTIDPLRDILRRNQLNPRVCFARDQRKQSSVDPAKDVVKRADATQAAVAFAADNRGKSKECDQPACTLRDLFGVPFGGLIADLQNPPDLQAEPQLSVRWPCRQRTACSNRSAGRPGSLSHATVGLQRCLSH